MARTYADLVNLVEQRLQDTGNATFVAAEINYEMEESLKELSSYFPHIVEVPFKVESRSGTASATSGNNLVDSNKSQFVAADATDEKVVYNVTDHTWATVSSFSSASQVELFSNDIFTAGEEYKIFNKRCRNDRQIYIGDMGSFIDIVRAEYRTNQFPREWRTVRYVTPDVIELELDFTPDDSNASQTSSYVDVILEVKKTHILSQLTDLSGEINRPASGYGKGETILDIDGMGSTETIEEGSEFHIENLRQTYIVTQDVTTSSNEATITIFPPLEGAITDDDDITFVGSTLLQHQEDALVELVIGRLLIYHSSAFLDTINVGGTGTFNRFLTLGKDRLAEARRKMTMSIPPKSNPTYTRQ